MHLAAPTIFVITAIVIASLGICQIDLVKAADKPTIIDNVLDNALSRSGIDPTSPQAKAAKTLGKTWLDPRSSELEIQRALDRAVETAIPSQNPSRQHVTGGTSGGPHKPAESRWVETAQNSAGNKDFSNSQFVDTTDPAKRLIRSISELRRLVEEITTYGSVDVLEKIRTASIDFEETTSQIKLAENPRIVMENTGKTLDQLANAYFGVVPLTAAIENNHRFQFEQLSELIESSQRTSNMLADRQMQVLQAASALENSARGDLKTPEQRLKEIELMKARALEANLREQKAIWDRIKEGQTRIAREAANGTKLLQVFFAAISANAEIYKATNDVMRLKIAAGETGISSLIDFQVIEFDEVVSALEHEWDSITQTTNAISDTQMLSGIYGRLRSNKPENFKSGTDWVAVIREFERLENGRDSIMYEAAKKLGEFNLVQKQSLAVE